MIRLAILIGAASLCGAALAQQPAAAPPAFAPANLSPNGVRAMAANCAACHGTNGKPQSGSTVPGLAGVSAATFSKSMQDFKEGKREATLMHQIAKAYSAEEIAALADFFSKQTP